jgi:hypothetical protein
VENIDRVDVSVNGRPCSSLDIDSDTPDPLELPAKPDDLKSVQLRGFFKEKLVASCLAKLH